MTARFKEYLDMVDQLTKEGKLEIRDTWVDHSGHCIVWSEFDSMESFAQLWSLENRASEETSKKGLKVV